MNTQNLLNAKKHLLGIALCVLIAMAAKYISLSLHWPVMLVCLACGFALNPFCSDKRLNAGINFSAKTILRLGVVLIGARFVCRHDSFYRHCDLRADHHQPHRGESP